LKRIVRTQKCKTLCKEFYKWRYSSNKESAIEDYSLSEVNEENIEDEKAVEIKLETLKKEIEISEDKFTQLINQTQRIHDVEMKVRIKSICQEMMKEVISQYLIYKQHT